MTSERSPQPYQRCPRRKDSDDRMSSRARWLALLVLCLGDLMIVLDVTIVGVALPSIRRTSASPRSRSRGS